MIFAAIGAIRVNMLRHHQWANLALEVAGRLSGRVLDSRLRGSGFEPHWHHCVVSLSKNINPSLDTDSTQEDPSPYN